MGAGAGFLGRLTDGATIIASILLAFAIDAWWDEKQEQTEAYRLLSSVVEEARTNKHALEVDLRYRYQVKAAIEQIFEAAASHRSMPTSELDDLIGSVIWYQPANVTFGALDSIISGGYLHLIENPELRRKLAEMYDSKDAFSNLFNEEHTHLFSQLTPYLRKHASYPQIANSRAAQRLPGSTVDSYTFLLPLAVEANHSKLLEDSEFLGLLVDKYWSELDFINWNLDWVNATDPFIQLVTAEIPD